MLGHGKPIVTVSSSPSINSERRRFGIAHELGHLEMHRGHALLLSCTREDIQDKPDGSTIEIEKEANDYASAFLMPARFVGKPFTDNAPSFDLIAEWASILQTSLTATAFRFVALTSEPVAVVYSHDGIIRYFQGSAEFRELGVFPDVRNRMGTDTDASRIFRGLTTKNQWHETRASAWFRENKAAFDDSDVVKEWSISMPSYAAVLSLLWVEEPLGEDSTW